MKKLKICMICSEFPPKCAGIGQSVYNISKGLIEEGNQVTIITRGGLFGTKKEIVNGIIVYRVPFIILPPPLHIKFHGIFVNRLFKKIDNFDLIHLHSPLVPLIKTNKPKILTVHSCWDNESNTFDKITDLYSLYINLFKKAFKKIELKSMNNCNQIITISKSMSEEIKKYNKKFNCKIIGNGIDISKFKSLRNKKEKNKILWIGRLVSRKGILDLPLCAKIVLGKYPSCEFLVAGEGSLRKRLEKEVQKQEISKNFKILGNINHKEIPRLFNNSSIFILTSYYEPFGIVTAEAMASGLPIVGTNVGGTIDLVDEGINGLLVPKKDSQALADAIIKLLNNPNLAKQMGENGRKKIIKGYTKEKIAHNYLKIYNKITK